MDDYRLPLLPLILDNVPPELRSALAQEGIAFCDRRPGPPKGRFLLFDSRRPGRRTSAAGQIVIDAGKLVDRAIPAEGQFFHRAFLEKLRQRIERAGGVWLRVSPFPFPYRSAFGLRVDVAKEAAERLSSLLATVRQHAAAVSLYFDAAAASALAGQSAQLAEFDIGSLGARQIAFSAVEENLKNVQQGIDALRAVGASPTGFASPRTRHWQELLAALGKLGLTHVCEAAAQAGLPYHALDNSLLVIPTRPMPLGEGAIDDLERDLENAWLAGAPLLLDAPLGSQPDGFFELVSKTLAAATSRDSLWRTTLAGMNAWWRARSSVRMTVRGDRGRLSVVLDQRLRGYKLAIEFRRGEHVAVVPLQSRHLDFSPDALVYEKRRTTDAAISRRDEPQGLHHHLRRLVVRQHAAGEQSTLPMRQWAQFAWHWWRRKAG